MGPLWEQNLAEKNLESRRKKFAWLKLPNAPKIYSSSATKYEPCENSTSPVENAIARFFKCLVVILKLPALFTDIERLNLAELSG